MKWTKSLALIAFVIVATALTARVAEAKDPNRVEGRVSYVSASSVAIVTQDGTERIINVPPTAKVERNGRRVLLTSFQLGDRGQARLMPGTSIATKVEAVGQ